MLKLYYQLFKKICHDLFSLQSDHYIAFGISGSDSGVLMFGGDVTWTWLDNEGVHAGDLDLSAYAQVTRCT